MTPTPATKATYNGGTGNWSNPASWNPAVVPNNGNNGTDYDVFFSSGTLTQDIVAGVIINQLFMSGGTLVLANPLTLEVGLQFSGGSIISGTLNIAGLSSQSALMTVSNTTLNNSGSYDLVLNGDAFSGGGSVFNNSGTLTAHATDGMVTFNIPLSNTGTVSAELGTFVLTGGGTSFPGLPPRHPAPPAVWEQLYFHGWGAILRRRHYSVQQQHHYDLLGPITNNSNLVLNSTVNLTDLVLNGDVTLMGGGTISLTNFDRILGSGILTNVGNLIEGDANSGGSLGN